jgi:hypothetical protein
VSGGFSAVIDRRYSIRRSVQRFINRNARFANGL